ncbi:hypothetical protein BDV95DRAFT_583222 [Massariosphaeria phaeospora]|uniref:Uncharacterized protein n=1 Tax=Massariosphaeria phaeospora TaxID=100035 RepID=A0A7C8M2S1_9PLEO|nr:hypothetical protein BDV95DRAFT_583222 [Massariosphaeria phaeospora]
MTPIRPSSISASTHKHQPRPTLETFNCQIYYHHVAIFRTRLHANQCGEFEAFEAYKAWVSKDLRKRGAAGEAPSGNKFTSSMSEQDYERIEAEAPKHKGTNWLRMEFNSQEEASAYRSWRGKRLIAEHKKAQPPHWSEPVKIPASKDVIHTICTANFHIAHDIARVTTMLELTATPPIGLGTCRDKAYRLMADIFALAATKELDWDDARDPVPAMFLGINRHVVILQKPGEKRKRNRKDTQSDESDNSTNSENGNDETGFVFYQLGKLQCNDFTTPCGEKLWSNTGYVVVVVINANGGPGDVWLLYDFNPEDDETMERHRVSGDAWGYLPGDSAQRAGVRIARKLSDLKDGYPLDLPDPNTIAPGMDLHDLILHEYELVRVVEDGFGPTRKLVRQSVSLK